MKTTWIGVLLLLLPATTLLAQTTQVRLGYQPGQSWLQVDYQLPASVSEFLFEPNNVPQRSNGWQTLSGDWRFDGVRVRKSDGSPFDTFTLRLAADTRLFDRLYIAVENVGTDGWVVFLPALMAAYGETVLQVEQPVAHVSRFNGATSSSPLAPLVLAPQQQAQLLYLGPAVYVDEGMVTMVAGAEIPAWLRDNVLAMVTSVVATLEASFSVQLPHDPTLLLTSGPQSQGSEEKGSTYPDGMIAFALRGVRLNQQDALLSARIAETAAHEAVHLFNGGVWHSAVNRTQPWLHEGSAEYLASRLVQDAESLREEAQQRLNSCLSRTRPLDGSQGIVAGRTPYDCGFIVQLAADAAASGKGSDIFALWAETFRAGGENGYTPEMFRDLAATHGGDAFLQVYHHLVHETSLQSSATLVAGLSALGVVLAERPADQRESALLRQMALTPVLQSLCEGVYGFTTMADMLVLDTGDRCGNSLQGDPAIAAAQGVNLFTDPVGAYQAIRNTCAQGEQLAFMQPAGNSLPLIECHAVVPALPGVFEMSALDFLPTAP